MGRWSRLEEEHKRALERQQKWDKRFLALAEHIAQWSKDPSTKVGAVIVDPDNRLVSVGYNGLPKGVQDLPERLENRDIKYKIIIHGERNALLFANRPVKGYTIYTWPMMPCSPCASMIVQAGIIRVVSPNSNNPRWLEDMKLSKIMFDEAHISLDLIGEAA